MKLTLLEWDRTGRSGHFTLESGTGMVTRISFEDGWYLLETTWSEHISTEISFSSFNFLCRYLKHGPSEIEGEVRE